MYPGLSILASGLTTGRQEAQAPWLEYPGNEQSGNRRLRYPCLGTLANDLTPGNPGIQAIGSWARQYPGDEQSGKRRLKYPGK